MVVNYCSIFFGVLITYWAIRFYINIGWLYTINLSCMIINMTSYYQTNITTDYVPSWATKHIPIPSQQKRTIFIGSSISQPCNGPRLRVLQPSTKHHLLILSAHFRFPTMLLGVTIYSPTWKKNMTSNWLVISVLSVMSPNPYSLWFFLTMAILSQGNITTWKCSVNYPLGICYIAIENIPFIVDWFTHKEWWFSMVFCMFTRR